MARPLIDYSDRAHVSRDDGQYPRISLGGWPQPDHAESLHLARGSKDGLPWHDRHMSEIPSSTSAAVAQTDEPVPEVLVRSLEFLVKWQNEQLNAVPNPPESLYHYTDASALVSIASGQQLWATNAVFMNDQTEVRHAAALLRTLIGESEGEGDASKREGPDVAVRHLLKLLHNFVGIYVVSFCAESDLLSQWRGYGGTDVYAIEFDGPSLLQLGPATPRMTPVSYDEDVQRRWLKKLLDRWRSELRGVECSESGWFKASALLAQAFGPLAISCKNRAFEEEREWRLFYSRLRLPQTLPEEYFPVEFRARGGLIVPFVKFIPKSSEEASDRRLLPIRSICVGPHRYPALAASGVWHLINERKMGDDVPVTNSVAPLRL
jgi:hypothetical protein